MRNKRFRYLGAVPTLLSASARLLHPFLNLIEKSAVKEIQEVPSFLEPVFIVGTPRSGSTILYQALTNQFNVLYPDNFTNHVYRDFFVATCLSQAIYHGKPHNCFESLHGRTYACGLNAPSEFSGFWYCFFPSGKDYLEKGEVNQSVLDKLRNKVYSVSSHFQKPFIFKNLHLGQRLLPIHQTFPNAKVIFIKRDPVESAQSMIAARRKDKVANHEMWSVKPKNHQELVRLPEYEKVIGQLYYLEKGIVEAIRSCTSFRFLTVHYEDFCEQPSNTVKLISSHFFDGQIGERKGAISPKVIKRPKESTENHHLVELASKYDWDNYTTP